MKENKIFNKGLIIGGLACIGILFAAFVVVFIVYVVVQRKENTKKQPSIEEYQYFHLNPQTNETSIGLLTMGSDEFGTSDYLSYRDDDGSYYLISSVESNEYYCTGSCSCLVDDQRRVASSSNIIYRGMMYLVAATSTIIAIQSAKSYFEEECENSLSTSCPSGSIVSEVDKCMSLQNWKRDNERNWEVDDKRLDFDDPSIDRFLCKGWCLLYDLWSSDENVFYKNTLPDQYNPCINLRKAAIITTYLVDTKGFGYTDFENAREKFRRTYLKRFCDRRDEFVIEGVTYAYSCKDGHKNYDENVHCRKATPDDFEEGGYLEKVSKEE